MVRNIAVFRAFAGAAGHRGRVNSNLTRPTTSRNHAAVPFSRMLALLLVALVLLLAPATYASPPDPTWLSGYWDDDDFDDVVLLLEGTVAVVPPLTIDATPPRDVVALLDDAEPATVTTPVDATASPRAPPLPPSAS